MYTTCQHILTRMINKQKGWGKTAPGVVARRPLGLGQDGPRFGARRLLGFGQDGPKGCGKTAPRVGARRFHMFVCVGDKVVSCSFQVRAYN